MKANATEYRGKIFWGAATIVLLGAVIRARGAMNELWLDEAWTVLNVRTIPSWWEIFTSFHHEINHPLNTLWIYLAGAHGNWIGYRVPSLIAGVVAVVVGGLIAARRSVMDAIAAITVLGFSYLLVLYSSEARGYSMASMFALGAFYILQSSVEERYNIGYAVAFSACEILGILSHLTFLNVMAAALCWSIYRESKGGVRYEGIVRLVQFHAIPWVFFGLLYWFNVRHIVSGGGSPASLIDVYGSAFAWAVGASTNPFVKLVACITAVTILVLGLRLLRREGSNDEIFYAGVIVVFPVLLVVGRGSDVIYPRHFLLSMVFLLLLASYVLAWLWKRGSRFRVAAALIFFCYFAMNTRNIVLLFEHGRGSTRDYLRFIANSDTSESVVTFGGDQDFRAIAMLKFFGSETTGGKTVSYVTQDSWPKAGVSFVVVHGESYEAPVPPSQTINDKFGHIYRYVKTFPSAPIAGMHVYVYQRATPKSM